MPQKRLPAAGGGTVDGSKFPKPKLTPHEKDSIARMRREKGFIAKQDSGYIMPDSTKPGGLTKEDSALVNRMKGKKK